MKTLHILHVQTHMFYIHFQIRTQRGGIGLVGGEARAEGGGLIPGGGDAGLERRRRRLRVCGGGGIGGRRIARGRRGGDAVIDGRDWRWVQRAGRRRGDDKKIKCTGSL